VSPSWNAFAPYLEHNVAATQRLLAMAAERRVKRFVFSSSSSVYGDAPVRPMMEEYPPAPISPYGVSKSAAEQLALAYSNSFDLPVIILRYFTVYGPRQRPDMAIARFIDAIARHHELDVYGDGRQTRDVTYVSDVVEATVRAGERGLTRETINIAGGSSVTVLRLIEELGELLGASPRIHHRPARPGDVIHTEASVIRARELLGYSPAVSLTEGLRRQVEWWQNNRQTA
jgi:nucleoside-diphosphate-sugar epimerase